MYSVLYSIYVRLERYNKTPTPLFSCRHGEREILASGGRRLLGKDYESYHSYYAIWGTSLRV
jgi:hypothetical protein